MYKQDRRGWYKHWDFTLMDLFCMQLAFIISFYIRFDFADLGWVYSRTDYRKIAILVILLQLVISFFTEAYKNILKRGFFVEATELLKDQIMVFALLIFYFFITKQSGDYSRSYQAIFFVVSFVITYIGRLTLKRILLQRLNDVNVNNAMLIVCMEDTVEEAIREFTSKNYLGSVVVGAVVLDRDRMGEEIEGVEIVANADNLYDYVAEHVVDEVFLNGSDQELCESIADHLLLMGVTVHINLIRVSTLMPNRMVERCGKYMVLTTSMRFAGPRQILVKRAADIVGSLFGILITVILFIIFAPIIKIQSPGPVFFKQVRVGKNGRRFNMYKFRTMVPNAEELKDELLDQNEMQGIMFKIENDPRIIPIGHFLRRYSLDEFPQFFSVFAGHMSLVGTRPPTEVEYEAYAMHHRARLSSKPGITGLWQVSGRNTITDFEEIVALDVKYIEEWTLGLDIKILFKTIAVVLKGDGSY